MADSMRLLRRGLEPLASLKLTVVLFALSMFLIFFGTLAQVHAGIWTVMANYFRTPVAWIELQLFVPQQLVTVPGHVPFPGGFVIGALLVVNLIAAHVARFKFNRRRVGIILLHLGIIVLLVGEFVTALFAEEGLMSIHEGGYAHYVEDIREAELVVIDRSDPATDRVIAVPESKLTRPGRTVAHEALPFDVTVERWMANSHVVNVGPGADNPATAGAGTTLLAERAAPVSGIDGQTVDAPSAYVSLTRDGESLGTWLVSAHLNPVQAVTVGDRSYTLALRFKRTYKPFTLHLLEFRHDRFVGTERARNFSSRIRLVDPTRNEDREVLIYMNHPLRYAGATFYQSAYMEDDSGTILQVVRNPGWLLPYIACAMVSLGMLWHFVAKLGDFVRKGAA